MFSYLRYIALACLVLMVAGSYLFINYLTNFKETDATTQAERLVIAETAGFSAAVWQRYGAYLIASDNSPYLLSFQQETDTFFKKQPSAIVTIFSADSRRGFYSTDATAYPSQDGSTRIPLFNTDKIAAGQVVSRRLDGVQILGGKQPSGARTMVQVVAPLMSSVGKPEALVEAYIDVTDALSSMNRQLYTLVGAFIGSFALLMGGLVFMASRAEGVISKQHEVNLELIAAAAQAEAQSRDKSQFLASVSHELRTPLNAIIGFSDIIRNEAKDRMEKVHQEYVDDINASGKHLLSLINDILDFSKAEAGKLQIEWAETDVSKVIRNSLRMVLPRAEAAQVTLVEDLPQQHLVLVTDAKKLKQVLLNLLSNAVKFTPAGGEVRCHVWLEVVSGALSIQVRDTGIGIAPKDISRVMTPFGQVDSALSRKYEGTGLGLPLSKKFVESMGGTFTIESELNVGTSVTITIPKAPPGWSTNSMNPSAVIPPKEASNVAPANS